MVFDSVALETFRLRDVDDPVQACASVAATRVFSFPVVVVAGVSCPLRRVRKPASEIRNSGT